MCSHCDFHRTPEQQKEARKQVLPKLKSILTDLPGDVTVGPDFEDVVLTLPKPKMTTYIPSTMPEYAPYPMSEGTLHFTSILRDIEQMHFSKQEGYGTAEDPFSNLRASENLGIPAWKGALVRLNDKIARLNNYALYETLPHEGVADNFKDAASYAILALVLLEESLRKADAP